MDVVPQKPTFVPPASPTLVAASPSGDEWLREIKHDGYRTIAVAEDRARVFTRRGRDSSDRMPGIAQALVALRCRSAVIGGEAEFLGVMRVGFFALHAALARQNAPEAQLVTFDLLHLSRSA
jgi:bifunctional non-homologous end joining protein LigD